MFSLMQAMGQDSEEEITIGRTEEQVVGDTQTERAEQEIDTNETNYENGSGVSNHLIYETLSSVNHCSV